MNELTELAKPFPDQFIADDGRGNSYVPHHIVTQRLIHIFKQPPRIEILREIYDGEVLTGVVMRLTVLGFEPVEEGGEADNPQSKTNGARLKDACSDAIKRCSMRLGLGLHLWSGQNYILYNQLKRSGAERAGTAEGKSEDPAEVGEGGAETTRDRSSTPPDLLDDSAFWGDQKAGV